MSSIGWENEGMQVPELWNLCWYGMSEFQKLELPLRVLLAHLQETRTHKRRHYHKGELDDYQHNI